MRKMVLIALMSAALAASGGAQEPTWVIRYAEYAQAAPTTIPVPVGQVQARITTGTPYSADAITESTQVLSDGNRISTKNVTRTYRDGEGRSRREQVDSETGQVRSVTISDPVAGVSYTLDPVNRIATRTGAVMAGGFGARGGRGGGGMSATQPRSPEPTAADLEKLKQTLDAAKVTIAGRVAPAEVPPPAPAGGGGGARGRGGAPGETTREELALQTIEGVPATGTRSTTVIPAGAIGNLQPIKIVSEQWMSPDLKVLVMTKHSDPRTGETIYRLSNIVRAEPDRSLFTVPPDYTLRETNVRRQPQ